MLRKQADGSIQLALPIIRPLDAFVAPAGCSRLELRLVVAASQANGNDSAAGEQAVLEIPYNGDLLPAKNVLLEMLALAGSVLVISAALSYWNGNKRLSEEGFRPAEIVTVIF